MITQVPIWDKPHTSNGYFQYKEVKHDDLMPCPFCGGPAEIVLNGDAWHARCKRCFAKSGYQNLPARWNSNKCLDTHLIKKAVKTWNKRVK